MTRSHDRRIPASGLVVAPARPAARVRGRPQVLIGSTSDGGGHLVARSILRHVCLLEARSWDRW